MFQGLRRWYVWLKHQGWSVHIFGIFSRHCHGFMNVCTWSQSLTFWSIWMLTSSQILGPRSLTDEGHTWCLISVSCTIFKVSLEDSALITNFTQTAEFTPKFGTRIVLQTCGQYFICPPDTHLVWTISRVSYRQSASYNYLLWLLDFWTGQLTEVSKFLHIQ